MIVKVGEQKVNSADYPIIVEFDEDELKLLRTLDETHNILYSYPIDADLEKVEKWVERRINEEDDEDPEKLSEDLDEGNER